MSSIAPIKQYVCIYSKQHITFLCNSHLFFLHWYFFKSRWCNHTVILPWPQVQMIRKIRFPYYLQPVNNSRRPHNTYVNIAFNDEILLPKCQLVYKFLRPAILCIDCYILFKTHMGTMQESYELFWTNPRSSTSQNSNRIEYLPPIS